MNPCERVAAALATLPLASNEAGAGRWRLAIDGEGAIELRVAGAERWLEIDAACRPAAPSGVVPAARLLALGARLGGLARVVLDPRHASPRLRADLPLDLEGSLAPLLLAAVGGVASALATEPTSRAVAAPTYEAPGAAQDTEDLERLCGEAGYAVTARRPTLLAIDLDLDVPVRARLACEPGGVRVRAEIAALPAAPSPVCVHALACFLLAASADVRMVRPFASHALDAAPPFAAVGFEARLGNAPCARAVGHALGALRTAASLAAREADALARDAGIAATFLELREEPPARERAPQSVNPTCTGGEQR